MTPSESEYTVVLESYNAVLDEFFAGADVYVITPLRTTEAEVPSVERVTGHWPGPRGRVAFALF